MTYTWKEAASERGESTAGLVAEVKMSPPSPQGFPVGDKRSNGIDGRTAVVVRSTLTEDAVDEPDVLMGWGISPC